MKKRETKNRLEVYDWLRGLASIAVVIGHYKPFEVPKVYLLWSVHTFVLITLALISQSRLDTGKLIRRLSYLAFVYLALLLAFHPFFMADNRYPDLAFSALLFDLPSVLIQNPYFRHLWYLALYVQILLFLYAGRDILPKLKARFAVPAALLVSQSVFLITFHLVQGFDSLFLPSWLLVMAAGWFWLPKLVQFASQAERGRIIRCLAALGLLAALYTNPFVHDWLSDTRTRCSLLTSAVFFIAVYFLAEVYFLVRSFKWFRPFKSYVTAMSRYTLVVYIYHQGVYQLALPYSVNPALLTVFSLCTAFYAGRWIHGAYLRAEQFFSGAASGTNHGRGAASPLASAPAPAYTSRTQTDHPRGM